MMINELELVRNFRAEEPPASEEAHRAARAALMHLIASDAPPAVPRTARRRLRVSRGRGRLMIVLAILALGAAAAVARTILNLNPTQLAANYIRCVKGTGSPNNTGPGYELDESSRSPVAACRQAYRASGPAALAKPNVRLIACAQNTGHTGMVDGVYVYEATGKPGQCEGLGMYPLPVGYTAAQARVHTLVRALGMVYYRHDCVSPTTLAREVQGVLDRLGFSGWHTRQMPVVPPSASAGPCGTFPGAGTPHGDVASDPAAAVDGGNRVVIIQTGRPQSMNRVIETEGPQLSTDSGRRCYSAAAARELAMTSLAHAHVPILFATSAELKGQQFDPARQAQYDSGCVVIVTVNTSADGHTIDVWLNSRSTPTLPAGEGQPSPRDYTP